MNFFIFLIFLTNFLTHASDKLLGGSGNIVDNEKLQLSKSDHIIGEHLIRMIQFTEKGYINTDVLSSIIKETEKSKHYGPFIPWLKSVQQISKLSTTTDLIVFCSEFKQRKETLPLERALERLAGNYCRERALESIGREIDKTKILSDESIRFIQENLKFFLTKKNKKNFAYFIQSQLSKPEILKRISQEVTAYSVQHEVIPSQEVLKDILINEQITKLIQDKGFNPLQHQNVFYAEYGKLIQSGHKLLETKPSEDKVLEHYRFLKNYLDLNQDHLPIGLCLTRLNDLAKAFFRHGFKDLSRDVFKFIIKKNNKEIIEDAQFFLLWTYIYSGEYKESLKVANQYDLIRNSKSIVDARLRFWIGMIHEELGNTRDAISLYEEIVVNNPLSYYAIMASKKLQFLKPDSSVINFYVTNSLPMTGKISVDIKDLDEDHISSLVRLKAWSKIDSAKLLRLELKRLKNHTMPALLVKTPTEKQLSLKSDLHLLNATFIQNSQNYLATFRYLYEVLDKKEIQFSRALLDILYPRPYLEVLNKFLKGDQLDPIIVLSLIRQESVFNPMARSPVGALGLMQLMPRTAKRFRSSVGTKQLVNPLVNIELGLKYFKNLMKRYDGNLVFVLAAYNAGEARVEKWKGLYFENDESILKNIEAIPFLETRNYVKLIFRNIFFYKLIMDSKENLSDSKEHNKIFDVHLGFTK